MEKRDPVEKAIHADRVLQEIGKAKRAKARRLAQAARDDALRSLGLVKVRSASGRVYWE